MGESRAQQASVTRGEVRSAQAEPAQPSFGERLRAARDHRPDPIIDPSRDGEREDEPRGRFAQQLDEIRNQQAEHALDHDRGEGIEI
jgi:hypothetical protein